MRLTSFHVRVFRNIIDSGPITVLENTCLVGKNEAGKSALINALHRLQPAKPVVMELLFDLYNKTFAKTVALADLQGDDRIIKRLERHAGAPFNHGRVAQYFLNNQATIIPKLSEESIKRFEQLITALNSALPKANTATK